MKDIVQYTIRMDLPMTTGEGEYEKYPFDTLTATLRIELSHFNIDQKNYRFDVYRQENEISFKKDCDQLPQFGVNYEACHMMFIEESKPYKKQA